MFPYHGRVSSILQRHIIAALRAGRATCQLRIKIHSSFLPKTRNGYMYITTMYMHLLVVNLLFGKQREFDRDPNLDAESVGQARRKRLTPQETNA